MVTVGPSASNERGGPGDTVENTLRSLLARRLKIRPDQVPLTTRFADLGVDSQSAAELTAELASALGRPLAPTLLWQHPTPETLLARLSGPAQGGASSAAVPDPVFDTLPHEPVAIVGVACRFPGAADPEQFWKLLVDGIDAVSDPPLDRPGRGIGPHGFRKGGFLPGIELFDPGFFAISPREAAQLDPQQRSPPTAPPATTPA
ncbi:MAG: hypothetical protein HY815_08010 [Candidatus Riflebacteria bacterium]|nr:hypothetical protein [Candidatus Riflebacteria bacterium]